MPRKRSASTDVRNVPDQHHGVFLSPDGRRRVAFSRGAAISMAHQGWRQEVDPTPEAQAQVDSVTATDE